MKEVDRLSTTTFFPFFLYFLFVFFFFETGSCSSG